jgi:hypothetical protein
MNKKQKFLKAVRILASDDPFVLRTVRRIPEERLPAFPGGVALEFVAMSERLRGKTGCTGDRVRLRRRCGAGWSRLNCRTRATLLQYETTGVVQGPGGNLRLRAALRVKAAEYWLKLGEPAQAIMELQGLAEELRKNPWVLRISLSAMRAIRENAEMLVQE